MEGYAALVSLMNVLIRIQHPSCPVFISKSLIQSLLDKVHFLVDFLENYSQISQTLERKIADAAYAAEDIIESYVVDQILAKKGSNEVPSCVANRYYAFFCQHLQDKIQEMDVIMEQVMKMKQEQSENDRCSVPARSLVFSDGGSNTMVGSDDELIRLMEQLAADQSSRQVVSVVGMGGIGKTTLARNIYNHPFIVHHFHVRAWVTVSHDYSVREIILGLLRDIGVRELSEKDNEQLGGMKEINNEQLGELLHKGLCGRRYLIILDDIWSSRAWDEIRRFLPDNNNRSRILLTTRLMNVALNVGSCVPYQMKFLDDDKSWELLSETIFGQEVCPLELEECGKRIAENCKGLPLAVVVIGGLLKMCPKVPDYWEGVAENVNTIINEENDEHHLKILSLSYNYLPIHLKPCFLYMATFKEDHEIRVPELIKLWIADGFLIPINHRTLEDVAEQYLNDLIDRNLVMLGRRGSSGKMKIVVVHDMLRELCLREVQKERFLCVMNDAVLDHQQTIESKRRFVTHQNSLEADLCMPSILARSFISNYEWLPELFPDEFRLLRVLGCGYRSAEKIPLLVNLRYLAFTANNHEQLWVFRSISSLWNLETLIINGIPSHQPLVLPSELWELPHLKHLVFRQRATFFNPVVNHADSNLQTLATIENFVCADELLNKLSNLKKLGIRYDRYQLATSMEMLHCFRNLVHLHKLENLKVHLSLKSLFARPAKGVFHEPESVILSPNLRKLTLSHCSIPWRNMRMVGSLPNLEVLKIISNYSCGLEWNSTEGEFQNLKYLSIQGSDLLTWTAESYHFPRLENLVLGWLCLEEIPLGIGEVTTLKSIKLYGCCRSTVLSAKQIQDECLNQGYEDLVIDVVIFVDDMDEQLEFESLENDKFVIDYRHSEVHL